MSKESHENESEDFDVELKEVEQALVVSDQLPSPLLERWSHAPPAPSASANRSGTAAPATSAQEGLGSIEHFFVGFYAWEALNALAKEDVLWPAEVKEDDAWDYIQSVLVQDCLVATGNSRLSPGQIIALAGDFYNLHRNAISGQLHLTPSQARKEDEARVRFAEAFKLLETAGASERSDKELRETTEAINALHKNVVDTLTKRQNALRAAQQAGQPPPSALKYILQLPLTLFRRMLNKPLPSSAREVVDDDDLKMNRRFGNKTTYNYFALNFFGVSALWSRYTDLALYNFDHFGDDARFCYLIGHKEAMAEAIRARSAKGKETDTLQRAVAMEMFACHFLTDLFASGHMRTPRRALYTFLREYHDYGHWNALVTAAFLSYYMHSEDGDCGLWVRNGVNRDQPFLLRGDDCLFEPDVSKARQYTIDAVMHAVLDVFEAFATGKPVADDKIRALKFIPKEDEEDPCRVRPLFREGPSVPHPKTKKMVASIERRPSVQVRTGNDPYKKAGDWSPKSTLVDIYAIHKLTRPPTNFEKADEQQEADMLKQLADSLE